MDQFDSRNVNRETLLAVLDTGKKTYMSRKPDRKKLEKLEKDTEKIFKWLEDEEIITIKDLVKKSGISRLSVEQAIANSEELQFIMKERRRMITSIATENLMEIVQDRRDVNNYQATKFVLENFKNELEEAVPSKTSIEASFDRDADGNISPVKIVFNTKK